jgi:glycerol-3-phosphate acyltransferase PlsX
MNQNQNNTVTVCVDAMGGDEAPKSEVAGAVETVRIHPALDVILVGPADAISAELKKHRFDPGRIQVHDCTEVIEMHESPTEAIKKKTDSSVIVGLNLHKERKADAFISTGNTGAVMAASLLILGRIANVSRPTIGSVFPTEAGTSIVFDVGANVDSKPIHLLEFAVMGSVYVKEIFGIQNPRVALLNIGEENTKGNTLTTETYQLLEKSRLNFIGNIEGRDILKGKAEVIICDGFVGNVVLKFAESVMSVLRNKFRKYASENFFQKIWVGLMYRTLKRILKDFDYQEYGGVPLLGVNGVSIIGHGRSTPKAVTNMILKAEQMVRHKINQAIHNQIVDVKKLVPA